MSVAATGMTLALVGRSAVMVREGQVDDGRERGECPHVVACGPLGQVACPRARSVLARRLGAHEHEHVGQVSVGEDRLLPIA